MSFGSSSSNVLSPAGTTIRGEVSDFASLPSSGDPSLQIGDIFIVTQTTGIRFINRKKSGLYRWDGVSFERLSDTTNTLKAGDDVSRLVNDSGYVVSSDLGWIQFSDTQYPTEAMALTVLQNVRTLLPNDALSVLNTNGPLVAPSWFSGNKFRPDSSGDYYELRLTFEANPTLNNRNLTVDLDIGGVQGIIWSKTERLARGAGVNTKVSLVIPVYTLGTFVANGGEIFLTCGGEVDVFEIVLVIAKVVKA